MKTKTLLEKKLEAILMASDPIREIEILHERGELEASLPIIEENWENKSQKGLEKLKNLLKNSNGSTFEMRFAVLHFNVGDNLHGREATAEKVLEVYQDEMTTKMMNKLYQLILNINRLAGVHSKSSDSDIRKIVRRIAPYEWEQFEISYAAFGRENLLDIFREKVANVELPKKKLFRNKELRYLVKDKTRYPIAKEFFARLQDENPDISKKRALKLFKAKYKGKI